MRGDEKVRNESDKRNGPVHVQLDEREVRGLPLFEGVEGRTADLLISRASALQYRAGATIVAQDSSISALMVIQRGIVDLGRVHEAHECGVLLLSSKDLLLPAAAIFAERSLVSARALTTTRLLVIGGDAVEEALTRSTALGANILKAMSGQWRMAVRNILDLNCRSAAKRLAAFLLHLADMQADSAPILPIPKRHLATRLGMSPETLSRMLQLVADNGLYLRGRTIIVRDRARISHFCGPDPYPERDEMPLNVFAF